jgi:hypothetical protein
MAQRRAIDDDHVLERQSDIKKLEEEGFVQKLAGQ